MTDRDRRLDAERGAADSVDRLAVDPTWLAAWQTEDNYWHENFSSRPYTIGPDYYERFRPAYRYGFESAHRTGPRTRTWEEAEPELRTGWDRYEHRGENRSTWDEIKDAVRDAWDRVMGEHHTETGRR
ncbi:MAG TPA: hypothetical protein VFT04_14430 [Gemmatimonadales bacterium]|nr:hypothetical protein [Gemmatimonadales bacterium]